MKIREKTPVLKGWVGRMGSLGKDKPMWRVLAEELNRPRRKRREVNLSRLEKYSKTKESVVVPGVVLGNGKISKPVSVFALKFSKSAEEKIKKAGGSCFGIRELLERQPKKLRIIG
jgi:large subunit ribosomal protein L18e